MTEQLNKKAQDILAKMKRCVAPNCAEEFANLLAEFIGAFKAETRELPEVGTVYHDDEFNFYYSVVDVTDDGESCLVALKNMPKISRGIFREGLITMTLGEFNKMNLKKGY